MKEFSDKAAINLGHTIIYDQPLATCHNIEPLAFALISRGLRWSRLGFFLIKMIKPWLDWWHLLNLGTLPIREWVGSHGKIYELVKHITLAHGHKKQNDSYMDGIYSCAQHGFSSLPCHGWWRTASIKHWSCPCLGIPGSIAPPWESNAIGAQDARQSWPNVLGNTSWMAVPFVQSLWVK